MSCFMFGCLDGIIQPQRDIFFLYFHAKYAIKGCCIHNPSFHGIRSVYTRCPDIDLRFGITHGWYHRKVNLANVPSSGCT